MEYVELCAEAHVCNLSQRRRARSPAFQALRGTDAKGIREKIENKNDLDYGCNSGVFKW